MSNRPLSIAALLVGLTALSCNTTSDRPHDGGATSTTAVFDEDVVLTLMQDDPHQPVAVRFRHHAAIYFLHRDDPHFDEWLAKLRLSATRKVNVRFNYDYRGQRLTSVEVVDG